MCLCSDVGWRLLCVATYVSDSPPVGLCFAAIAALLRSSLRAHIPCKTYSRCSINSSGNCSALQARPGPHSSSLRLAPIACAHLHISNVDMLRENACTCSGQSQHGQSGLSMSGGLP